MNTTEHYQLKKPISTEKYNVDIFNENVDTIDGILKEHDNINAAQDEVIHANKEETDAQISSLETSIDDEILRANKSETNLLNALQEEIERAVNAENINRNDIAYEINRASNTENAISETISSNKPIWDDKYTKNEIDNKFSSLETNIDWKESVSSYEDILISYPAPEDGWTVNVKDTNYTYRYDGNNWVPISANAIPKATNTLDGLLAKEDHAKYEDANNKKHVHENKTVLDTITNILIEKWNTAFSHISDTVKHITSSERINWGKAYTHSQSGHAPVNAEKNVVVGIQKNGIDIALDSSTRKVNVIVPTKVSELSNDSGYITTDNYLPKTGSAYGNTIFKSNNIEEWKECSTSTIGGTTENVVGDGWGTLFKFGGIRPVSLFYPWNSGGLYVKENKGEWKKIAYAENYLPLTGGTVTGKVYMNAVNEGTIRGIPTVARSHHISFDWTALEGMCAYVDYTHMGTIAFTTSNVASATKATQDGNGNNIVNTYATKTALQTLSNTVGHANTLLESLF